MASPSVIEGPVEGLLNPRHYPVEANCPHCGALLMRVTGRDEPSTLSTAANATAPSPGWCATGW